MNAVCIHTTFKKNIIPFALLQKPRHCRMASITRPLGWFNWFYHEFGLVSIQATGRNAYLIITARTMRMVSFGMTQVMLGKRSRLL
jgi:hypothetical protein